MWNRFFLFTATVSLFVNTVCAQVAVNPPASKAPDPGPWTADPNVQSVLDAQRTIWDHVIGFDSWGWEDLAIPLDQEIYESGQWVVGTSNLHGLQIALNTVMFVDTEINDPDNPEIPQSIKDYVSAVSYRSGYVYGNAYGPASGAIPIGFGGYTFRLQDEQGVFHHMLIITAVVDRITLDELAEADTTYQQLLADYGDLTDDLPDGVPEIAFPLLCPGVDVDPDAAFDACALQAAADYQCKHQKLVRRVRNHEIATLIGGIACLGSLVFPPATAPTCLGAVGLLGAHALCLMNAMTDIGPEYRHAINCCCTALQCRANGGGQACQTNADCNDGCGVPVCGH